ncbi:hypothetical protein [Burkholderia ubonensis]|uniref:hypothetical protein n=1 Tax=Burkholderia ubonensis TaxID=101571 RepID=UPI000AFF0E17|nr:hypothetical protein [Burkholderia ubonensis]
MEYKTNPRHFANLVSALREQEPTRPIRPSVAENLKRMAGDRWVLRSALEDVLVDMDPRLDSYGAGNPDALVAMLGLTYRNSAYRPKKNSSGVMLFQAIAAVELAEVLMHLEALGFRVDPEPLVSEIRSQLDSATRLSQPELSVFWYSSVRHRGSPITITEESTERRIAEKSEEWKTSTGYRVVADYAEGKPFRITAHAPKYRRKPEPVETICPTCGATYYRGDPESSANHRREHRRRVHYMLPEPHPKVLEARQQNPDFSLVTSASPKWMHFEMYERALAFKREFGYDFTQWGSPSGDDDPNVAGHLFTNDAGAIVGACSFRSHVHNGQRYRALQWIWFAPAHRREGHLSRYWPVLRKLYGAFHVEPPVSAAMQAFLARHSDSALLDLDAALEQAGVSDT